jgi:hypothetical protein
MMVGMAVLVTVISIEASTITNIRAAVTQRRFNFGGVFGDVPAALRKADSRALSPAGIAA